MNIKKTVAGILASLVVVAAAQAEVVTTWIDKSNLELMTQTTFDGISLARFAQGKYDVNASGLINSEKHKSKDMSVDDENDEGRLGYSYSGSGYNLGFNSLLDEKKSILVGIDFFQMFGDIKGYDYPAEVEVADEKIKQSSFLGPLSAAKRIEISEKQQLIIKAALGMISTENKFEVEGEEWAKQSSSGMNIALQADLHRQISKSLSAVFSAGVEYLTISKKDLKVTDSEDTYSERDGKLNNLSLNLGAGIQHVLELNSGAK